MEVDQDAAEARPGPDQRLYRGQRHGQIDLISFFRLIDEMLKGRLQEFIGRLGGADSVLYRGPKITPAIEAELEFDTGTVWDYYFRLTHAAVDTLIFSEERITVHAPGSPVSINEALGSGHRESSLNARQGAGTQSVQLVRLLIRLCRVYHFHDTSDTAPVRRSCYVEDNSLLRTDASNLAAVLCLYKGTKPTAYSQIVAAVRKVAPSFGDFVLEPRRLDSSKVVWPQGGRIIRAKFF